MKIAATVNMMTTHTDAEAEAEAETDTDTDTHANTHTHQPPAVGLELWGSTECNWARPEKINK